MTEAERNKLNETHEMATKIHDALMKPGPTGEPPFITRMGVVVVAVERSNWAARWMIRGFLTLGALAAALAAIKAGLFK